MKKRIIVSVAIIAIVALAVYLFIATQNANSKKELTLYGNVDVRNVALGFRVGGRISQMRFQEGDHIKAGDVIAILDKPPFEQAVLIAQGQADSAAANLAKMQHGSRPEEIQQARANVNGLQAQYDNAQRVKSRLENLFTKGATSQQSRDDADAAYDSAKAGLKTATEALNLALAGFRIEDLQLAEAGFKTAQAQLETAKIALQDTEIMAPESGSILTRIREPGSIVAAGSPVFDVALEDPIWVRTYVTEPELGQVYPGQTALIYTDSMPNKPYKGKVGFISTQAEFTPKNVETESLRTDLVYRLRIVVNNADKGLRQGMPVTVKVMLGDKKVKP